MAERDLNQTAAAKQIGIHQTGLWKLLHQPSPGMHRETARKLAAWDGTWTWEAYRARRSQPFDGLQARGRTLGAAGKGRPKPREQVEKIQAGRARTMGKLHRGKWRAWLQNKMVAANRARKGQPGKRRGPEVGQKTAAALRAKHPLYYKATGGLRRLAAQGGASLDAYLVLEYQVRESPEAVAMVRRAIKRRPGKRPGDYTLAEILSLLTAGRTARQIAEELVIERRRAQELIRLAHSVENRAL